MKYRYILLFASIFFLVSTVSANEQKKAGWLPDKIKTNTGQEYRETAMAALDMAVVPVSATVMDELRPVVIHSSRRGPKIVRLQRYVDGVEVYGQAAIVLLGKDGKPMALQHNLADVASAPLVHSTGFNSLKARKYWVESNGQLIQATIEYPVTSTSRGAEMNAELKSWPDGEVLKSNSVTDHVAFDYRVYDGDDPFGHSQPHPTGFPDGFRPMAAVPQVLKNIEGLSATSNDPWLPVGASETVGNNVDAFFNSIREADGRCDFNADFIGAWGANLEPSEGDFRALAIGNSFDYIYDETISSVDFFHSFSNCPSPDPDDQQINAKIVQAFYWGNLLHDFFYDAGFDEVSGNAQQDNYGRGGLDGDRLIIHAGSPTTFASTPGDGVSPILVMGRNSTSASNRDSTLDLSVFAHEWGHYMVRRLVGGGVSHLSTTQGRSLNEGWADFIGVLMNVKAADFTGSTMGASSSYAVGSYMN